MTVVLLVVEYPKKFGEFTGARVLDSIWMRFARSWARLVRRNVSAKLGLEFSGIALEKVRVNAKDGGSHLWVYKRIEPQTRTATSNEIILTKR